MFCLEQHLNHKCYQDVITVRCPPHKHISEQPLQRMLDCESTSGVCTEHDMCWCVDIRTYLSGLFLQLWGGSEAPSPGLPKSQEEQRSQGQGLWVHRGLLTLCNVDHLHRRNQKETGCVKLAESSCQRSPDQSPGQRLYPRTSPEVKQQHRAEQYDFLYTRTKSFQACLLPETTKKCLKVELTGVDSLFRKSLRGLLLVQS